MRTAALPGPTARQALVASLVAAAVAAPAALGVARLLDRQREAAAQPAQAAAAAAAPAKPASRKPVGPGRTALPGPGLPGSVAQALKTRPLVVVGLYVAGDSVDMAGGAEAEAGAALAGMPYVPVNVNDESQIGDLAARLPSLTVPSVAIIGKGGAVVAQLVGVVDRTAVAGAIDTALAAARSPVAR